MTIRPTEELPASSPDGADGLFGPPELLSAWGLVPGQQVRLRRGSRDYAAVTVRAIAADEPATVWIGERGRERLDTAPVFDATVETPVPHPLFDATEAARRGEYVERLIDSGSSGLAVVAPHGGRIEAYTDRQAERLVSRVSPGTAWIGQGWKPGGSAYDCWHVTATDIHPASYPGLASIADRGFEYAVSLHGFDGDGILVGGRAPIDLKRDAVATLERVLDGAVDVRLATDGPYDGDDPDNVVNWLTANGKNGVQIEQSYRARAAHGERIADAVATVFEDRLASDAV